MAKSGELPYQTHMNERNRPEYLFPLSSLPDAAQQKYFAEHAPATLPAAAPAKEKKADKPAACKPLEAYTAEERGEIGYWITTVDRWQTYRNKAGTKKEMCIRDSSKEGRAMEIAPMTKRDKILLYVVSMFAFIVLFVRFLLIPGCLLYTSGS